MRVLISCSIFVALLLLLNLEMSACRHRGVEEEAAESAMAGMTSLFHSMFPVVPGHAHFFWRTDQAATVHRTAPVREVIRDPDGGGGGGGGWPWRLQIDFNKRGPDCMRKCIMQGRLHPLQCHSLC